MSDKKTYGQLIFDHWESGITLDDDVIEYRRDMEPEIIANINQTIEKAKNSPQYINKNFYIVLLKRVERIGQGIRTFVFARQSCPTPIYKQSVWKYDRSKNDKEFLWSIPDMITYYHILRNQHKYLTDKETSDLAKFVILMESGELLEWVKRENGEKVDAVIKINQEPQECPIN